MNDLIIEKTIDDVYLFPNVYFYASTGKCSIEGESYQEETFEFFNNLIEWLVEYIENVKQAITLDFKLSYFNTSSSRAILEMLLLLKKYIDNGGEVTVNWYYLVVDDMIDDAEDLQNDSGVAFNMIPIEGESFSG